MRTLVPNLSLLLDRLDSDSLSFDLAAAFRDAETMEEAQERLSRTLEELVRRMRSEASSAT